MSCLFDSLSKHSKSHTSLQIRNIICNYLQTDPILIGEDCFSKLLGGPEKLMPYIRTMRNTNTWGSAYEIRAFCEIFQVVILVKTPEKRWIEFRPSRLKHTTHPKKIKLDWNGCHYEPIL